jgi:uncharacterized protein YbgA (DUF1722 family)/uncharacterized protein YbbK (DUF523 family)
MKPIVCVSKCLGFAACRYNGITIHDDFIEKLKPHVHYKTVCPEVDAGLGVPRDPVRIISSKGALRLVQPSTKKDLTDTMIRTCNTILNSLGEVDGCILKSRSPSCGIKDVKVYPRMGNSAPIDKNMGFFAAAAKERFRDLPIEDEGRMTNFRIREHFLTQIFTFARFRKVKAAGTMKGLVQFHAQHKFLLMAYNQTRLKQLGSIVANHEKHPAKHVYADYQSNLYKAFTNLPRYTSNINVLMHTLGYFSKKISYREKDFFLKSLEKYRNGKIPLSVNLSIIKSWVVRFNEKYLAQQKFFEPYPDALTDISDSGKGRASIR